MHDKEGNISDDDTHGTSQCATSMQEKSTSMTMSKVAKTSNKAESLETSNLYELSKEVSTVEKDDLKENTRLGYRWCEPTCHFSATKSTIMTMTK